MIFATYAFGVLAALLLAGRLSDQVGRRPVLLAALATLALVYFAWPVYRAFLPLQIDINEAWNAYQADMLRAGQSLYSSSPSGDAR